MFHAIFNGGFLSVFAMLFLLGLALRLATDAVGRVIAFAVCSIRPFFRKIVGVIKAALSAGKHNAKGESYLIPEGFESVDAFIKARSENGSNTVDHKFDAVFCKTSALFISTAHHPLTFDT